MERRKIKCKKRNVFARKKTYMHLRRDMSCGRDMCFARDMSCGRDMPSARYVLRTRYAAGDPLPPMRGVKETLSFAERTYRMRVYEHISNASLRAYIESSGARYIESRAARHRSFRRYIALAWDRAIRYVLRTRYAASGSICRAGRDEKKTKTPAPIGAGETGDRISR